MGKRDIAEQDRDEAHELINAAEDKLKHLLKKWEKYDDDEIHSELVEIQQLLEKAKRCVEPVGWAI